MMLRASSDRDDAVDNLNIGAAVDTGLDSGVPQGALLSAFADAAVGRTAALPDLRRRIADELGAQPLVDAAGVVANFQRMVRIADGCGIPLDDFTQRASEEWRVGLGIHEFRSSGNTFTAE